MTQQFYRTKEVRELLKVNEGKVLGWIDSGQLEAFNVGEGKVRPRYRISQAALDKFIALRTKVKPPSKPRRRKSYTGRVWVQ